MTAKPSIRFGAWRNLARDNRLLMNALYMMLSTFVLAACGFVFWAIVTRTHATPVVGLATTLVSLSGLFSLAGLLGFDTAFVRFLSAAPHKNSFITRGLGVVALATIALSVAAGVILPIITPELKLLHDAWTLAGFVFFTVTTGLNTLTNSLFLAYRRAEYILGITIVVGLCKIILPLVVTGSTPMTVFIIAGVAQTAGVVLSGIAMYWHFKYRPATTTGKANWPVSGFHVYI